MANPGIGFRSVWQMLVEISLHLLEPIVYTTTSSAITASLTPQLVTLGSVTNIVLDTQLIIDPGLPTQETILITEIASSQIQAVFEQNHASGAIVVGACFPTQAATDPFYTQSEILGYISRAQNEFLTRVPCYFLIAYGTISYGQITQFAGCSPIELIRVAISPIGIPITSLTRASGVVTAVTASAHNLANNGKFSIINATDPSYNGAFNVATVVSSTSFTYPQLSGGNGSTSGGMVGIWTRLKETTQEMLNMVNPGWQGQYKIAPSSWYEDRTGNYNYGVDCRPTSSFPSELLMSVRDSDMLQLGDGFLVPDICLHYVKYKTLEYCWSKDGEQRNPMLQQYAATRFDRGVMACLRWLDSFMGKDASSPVRQKARQPRAGVMV